eukprot:488137-Alexandrium_andersonii.AAC.1
MGTTDNAMPSDWKRSQIETRRPCMINWGSRKHEKPAPGFETWTVENRESHLLATQESGIAKFGH